MAIAEWKLPHSKERADYVLFSGERAVGIIEAKKYEEPVAADALNQAYDYYKHLKMQEMLWPRAETLCHG